MQKNAVQSIAEPVIDGFEEKAVPPAAVPNYLKELLVGLPAPPEYALL